MTLEERDRENYELGFKQGIEEGLEQGIREMATLVKQLIESGRYEDLERAADDAEYRKKLYQDLGI